MRERRSAPTLRFYAWSSPALSLGYAQQRERDVDLAACAARGIPVLRRCTGGRAVLHCREITYSVTVPAGTAPFGATLDTAYRAVAAGLLAGLRLLGLEASLAAPGRDDARTPRHPGCFAGASRHEIVAGGRKLVGSAQRRSGGAFLQHGSLLLEGHGDLLERLVRPPAGPPARGAMTGLGELLRPCPAYADVVAALAAGCAAAWGVRLVPGDPTAEEAALAGELERRRCGAEPRNGPAPGHGAAPGSRRGA